MYIYIPCMTVNFVIFLPNTPYIHRIYIYGSGQPSLKSLLTRCAHRLHAASINHQAIIEKLPCLEPLDLPARSGGGFGGGFGGGRGGIGPPLPTGPPPPIGPEPGIPLIFPPPAKVEQQKSASGKQQAACTKVSWSQFFQGVTRSLLRRGLTRRASCMW